ncbi:MAG: molybdate ABC transporter permease subunit [Nitrospirota bacterium]
MNWEAVILTLKLSFIVAPLLLVIALPISYFIAYSEKSWKFLLEGFVSLPLVLPPTVLGFYLLIAMGSKSPVGRFYEQIMGSPLVFSFNGLVIGSLFYSLPFAVAPLSNAFQNIDRRFLYQSQILGKTNLETFFQIILPLSYRGMLTALILSAAHTVGEFGVVLMIGGNIPGETRTLSIDLFDQVQAFNYQSASQTAAFLLCFSYLFLSLVYFVNRKKTAGGNIY